MSGNTTQAVGALVLKKLFKRLPKGRLNDRLYALARFVSYHGRFPRREGLYNDRLFYMKWDELLDDDFIRMCSDKELVKYFLRATVGARHVVPTLAVLRSAAEVEAYTFPQRCFAKGTAHSGAVLSTTDGQVDRRRLRKWLRSTHYDITRERNYRGLTPKIIVEPFVFGVRQSEDIKFLVYRGRVGAVQVDFNRAGSHSRRVYTRDWQDLDCTIGIRLSEQPLPRPECLDEMVAAAETIGAYFDFLRVDMYASGNEFRIGELTHCSGSADRIFHPPEAEALVSGLLFDADPALYRHETARGQWHGQA